MLGLSSPRWSELQHAYGNAADIPLLLERLYELPRSEGSGETWFTLWSALVHQGDVYSASFAAVPHIIAGLAEFPELAADAYFQFPAWVEICRAKHRIEVPDDLKGFYFEALARLPGLAAQSAKVPWEPGYAACALSAIAAAKGHHAVAEAILEMVSIEIAEECVEWMLNK